jgi:hypothetical protein
MFTQYNRPAESKALPVSPLNTFVPGGLAKKVVVLKLAPPLLLIRVPMCELGARFTGSSGLTRMNGSMGANPPIVPSAVSGRAAGAEYGPAVKLTASSVRRSRLWQSDQSVRGLRVRCAGIESPSRERMADPLFDRRKQMQEKSGISATNEA